MITLLLFKTERQLDYALDLMRRLPPQQIEMNLSNLIDMVSMCTVLSAMFVHLYDNLH